MKTPHIYPGAYSLTPYITIKGCSEAIEFYKEAFGATERGRLLLPNGLIGHAEIMIEGSMIMMADENKEWGTKSPTTLGGNPMSFGLYVKDADAAFKKAVDAGSKVNMPMDDMFYGDRAGQITDPFGFAWMICTHKKDVSFEEMQKGFDEMMQKQQ